MKQIPLRIVYVVLLFFLFAFSDVNKLIGTLNDNYKQIGCLEGRLKRIVSYGKEEIELYGNFKYCSPESFEIEYLVPFKEKIVSRAGSLIVSPADTNNLPLANKHRIIDFNWGIFPYLSRNYNFSFVWRGKIDDYSDVITLEGGPKRAEEYELPKLTLWIDMDNKRLLRFEGYNQKGACILILTNDKFSKIDNMYIPTQYIYPLKKEKVKYIPHLVT